MSDPTIRDVIDAIQKLNGKVDTLDAKIDRVRDELAAKIDRVDAKVDAHRAETAKGFLEIDRELTAHSAAVHRRLEDEIEAIKERLKPPATRAPARRPRRA